MEERFAKLQAGSGFTDGVTVGPLIDAAALAKMERQVADALDKGARLITGGERLTADGLDAGCFYAPTLLADVTPDMLIYREETFGPVAPVIVFDDDDEAIAMANDTDYGLASYVYTQSLTRAFRAVEAAEVRHGRRQRHQPDVGGGAVRRREADRASAARAPARASTSTSTPSSSASPSDPPLPSLDELASKVADQLRNSDAGTHGVGMAMHEHVIGSATSRWSSSSSAGRATSTGCR